MLFGNNAEFRLRDNFPVRAWTVQPLPLPSVGILHPLRSIPDVAANVELVVQNANAFVLAAEYGRDGPGPAARRRHSEFVEMGRNLASAPARGVLLINEADPLGFRLIDFKNGSSFLANRPIAIAPATSKESALHLPALATVGFLSKVV
ncbi:MAG: hypothetical protein MUC68_02520 [Burkholderiaceae bacterium]|nr:hypothetical protein [Burkholderiaceae bacterium]